MITSQENGVGYSIRVIQTNVTLGLHFAARTHTESMFHPFIPFGIMIIQFMREQIE